MAKSTRPACHLMQMIQKFGSMAWPSNARDSDFDMLQPVCWLVGQRLFCILTWLRPNQWPCNSLRSHHQRYHVVYNWFLLHRDHQHGSTWWRFFFLWLSMRNALMWDSEFHFIHLNIDFFIHCFQKSLCASLGITWDSGGLITWRCNGKGHSSFAREKLQVAFDRWKSCCLSSSNFVFFSLSRVPKCKNNFCKSIPTFAHLMCEPCLQMCVCWGGRICLATWCVIVFCKSFLQYWLGKAMKNNMCPLEVERELAVQVFPSLFYDIWSNISTSRWLPCCWGWIWWYARSDNCPDGLWWNAN